MNQNRVIILLSTYNGEKHIKCQLESLLSQSYKNTVIYIRDDGSTDNTIPIIESYQSKTAKLKLFKESNIGVVRSFIRLLGLVPANGNDIFAFCDQDDYWLSDKIERAVKRINSSSDIKNTLYCSRLEYVDEYLSHLGYSLTPVYIGFNNAVVENIAIGCTMAFGSNIRRRILQANPQYMMMHDWWAYLTASAFGHIVYDDAPTIRYRRHSTSVTAWEPGLVKIHNRFKGLIKRLQMREHKGLDSLNQAICFMETYNDMKVEHRETVEQLIDLRGKKKLLKRIRYILKPDVVRTDPIENWLLRPMILFGWH